MNEPNFNSMSEVDKTLNIRIDFWKLRQIRNILTNPRYWEECFEEEKECSKIAKDYEKASSSTIINYALFMFISDNLEYNTKREKN